MIDVTDVLTDPEFIGRPNSLTCLRNTQTVGSNGIATNAQQSFAFTGVVSGRRRNLGRGASAERISGSIVVYTTFALIAGSPTATADIVSWNGQQYTVTQVNAYPQFGRGFLEAVCELLPLSG